MRYFQRQGSTKVEVISEDRTASPNIWWPTEQMRIHGFSECPGGAKAIELEDAKAVEDMIEKKTRELAISELKKEGKLDQSGKIPKKIKP